MASDNKLLTEAYLSMQREDSFRPEKFKFRNPTKSGAVHKSRHSDIWYIVDSEDGDVFTKGTLEQLKEWWWKMLTGSREIGGYSLTKNPDSGSGGE